MDRSSDPPMSMDNTSVAPAAPGGPIFPPRTLAATGSMSDTDLRIPAVISPDGSGAGNPI
jgi:hypothetical protein